MSRRSLILLFFVGCGSSQAPKTESSPPAVGKQGDVCSFGEAREHPPGAVPAACGPGLSCCYPCGIRGCDSICQPQCADDIP